MRLLIVLLAALTMSGCSAAMMQALDASYSGAVGPTTAEEFRLASTPSLDTYTGMVRVTGPTLKRSDSWQMLRAWRLKDSNKWSVQVYVVAILPEWAFLDRAYADGKAYDTTQISREVASCSGYSNSCTVTETIGIDFSHAEFKNLAVSDFDYKLSGSRGEVTSVISAAYMQGFLQRLEQFRLGGDPIY